jgi:hypothetical protein
MKESIRWMSLRACRFTPFLIVIEFTCLQIILHCCRAYKPADSLHFFIITEIIVVGALGGLEIKSRMKVNIHNQEYTNKAE